MIKDFEQFREVKPLNGFQPDVGRLVWIIEAARFRLYEVLEELEKLNTAVLDWQPEYGGNSIGTLLYHIAAIEIDWLYCEVLEKPFPPDVVAMLPYPVRDGDGRLTAVTGESLAQHQQRLDQCRQHLHTTYQNISVEAFRTLHHFEHYDVTPEWVLHHLIQHETEHRGQITEVILLAQKALG